MKKVQCRQCEFNDDISKWQPCLSAYQDIRCPECGSTDNEHNAEYQKELFAAMNN